MRHEKEMATAKEEKQSEQSIIKKGVFLFPNGDQYEGDYWVNENGIVQRHGSGTFAAVDGLRYQGSWIRDKMHGPGRLVHPSGAVYEGEFVQNKYQGWGKYSFPNGSCYEGKFVDNKVEGRSQFTDAYGQVWHGSFQSKGAPVLKFKLDM